MKNDVDTPEQVLKFVPKERPRSYGILAEEAGQAIIAKIQEAADRSNENCDRAMKLAHKLSMQLRAAEANKSIRGQIEFFRDRAARAEPWLQTIQEETPAVNKGYYLLLGETLPKPSLTLSGQTKVMDGTRCG
jgi:hypothetical protein